MALDRLTASTQSRELASLRFRRARKLARSQYNEKFRKSLGALQQELTDSLTNAFQTAQDKGFLNKDFENFFLFYFNLAPGLNSRISWRWG